MFSKKKERLFILLLIFCVIFYLIDPEFFWKITLTPYITSESILASLKPCAICSNKFYDFRYLQYISGYIDSVFLSSDILYNSYKSHPSSMVLNYPRIWVLISHYSNIQSDTVLYSTYLIFFLLYSYIFLNFTKKFQSYFFCYLFISGANLLLLERGNVDFAIIVLIFYPFIIVSIAVIVIMMMYRKMMIMIMIMMNLNLILLKI